MREALVTIDDAEFASLGIEELVALSQEAGIREFDELACHGDSSVVQVEVEQRLDEDRLDSLEYVEQWERVSESTESSLYVIAFSVPDVSESLAAEVQDLVGTCDPDVTDRGATLSLVGSQDTIAETISEYEKEGVTPDLERLGEYRGSDEPLAALTDRQREIVETAYEMDYYDVPRNVSTADIAAELALDPSTVAEHLQRAERNLLSQHFSSA